MDAVRVEIATARRGAELAPIVFLHGFGSTKEDYVDLAYRPGFRRRPFLAYDAPGCRESSCADLSDDEVLSLPCRRMFMYGEQNVSLSYLPTLADGGVELAEIPHSGHFPMYSNPVAMWTRIADFHAEQAWQESGATGQ
jgi:pimeloyl-ACP methyl ester carboxylesterase